MVVELSKLKQTERENVIALNAFRGFSERSQEHKKRIWSFINSLAGTSKRKPEEVGTKDRALIVLVPILYNHFDVIVLFSDCIGEKSEEENELMIVRCRICIWHEMLNGSDDWYVLASHRPQLSMSDMALNSQQHYLDDRYGKN